MECKHCEFYYSVARGFEDGEMSPAKTGSLFSPHFRFPQATEAETPPTDTGQGEQCRTNGKEESSDDDDVFITSVPDSSEQVCSVNVLI